MYKNRSRGFTLIELLVVIAIIGILSAVVLASLNTARNKGNDAAVMSNLTTVRNQAEIFYSTGNTYGAAQATCSGAVFADNSIKNAIAAMTASAPAKVAPVCGNTTTAYAIQESLSTGGYFCVDSTGFAGSRVTALGTGTACPAS